jgi:hypothetical protein
LRPRKSRPNVTVPQDGAKPFDTGRRNEFVVQPAASF